MATSSSSSSSPALVLVSAFLLLLSLAQATSFEYCNKRAKYPVRISGVSISPEPVQGGKPAQFNISATTGDDISQGKVVIDVKYFFLYVHSETKELCEETSCPITTGDFVLSHQQTLPSFTPPGSYHLTMKIIGEDGKRELSCITFSFSIGFASSVADS
ncbi:phosphatidylglycerol/phosphatidylinositol transfer protein-like [Iris pallida]|uniref:Phosphatidylglycerol/phosphatidylinositol transfer protein-like n=1 Tax=Iris pallida TaxID=29817 RepID=A0AAX6H1B1_IRIPA|nr:phosphatidylglycerol/phosphatidylinositol transfer protein-like [Iris pallida]